MVKIKWNNWRDNLKDASFRGIPFKVLTSSVEAGRRNVLHQYPFSDEPYLEDLGGEAGIYHINAYIVQNPENSFDYFPERDKLKAALDEIGSGDLVHPFYGNLTVGVSGKYKIDESFTDGGIARFTITFVVAGRPKQAEGPVALADDADFRCNSALDTIQAVFETIHDVIGYAFLAQEAMNTVSEFVSNTYQSLITVQSTILSTVSQAFATIDLINSTIDNIITFPDQLADSIRTILDVYEDLIPDMPKYNTSLITAALSLTTYGDDFPDIAITIPERQQQLDNQNAMIDMIRCSGLTQAVRAAIHADYRSYEDAIAMLNILLATFDSVLNYIGANSKNDELFSLISGLKPVMVKAMLEKGANLPIMRNVEITPDAQPALVLAYNIYDDNDREQEIIDRNYAAMLHPGFPKGGEIIKVLSE